MDFSKKPPWWTTDLYDIDTPVLGDGSGGPEGVATVHVNSDGSTQAGWGLAGKKAEPGKKAAPGFMHRYTRHEFTARKTEWAYAKREAPFAYVMRSVPMICVDVDGKNGGFANMAQLGELPPTLAERSKSGNGLHLFYRTNEPWDDATGYALFDDQIGIATGIDIRATGCVYHYPSQRWNARPVEWLPGFLAGRLAQKKDRRTAQVAAVQTIKEMDDMDKLLAHHDLTAELAKPISAGKRNNTLFAIGSRMKDAEVDGWETLVQDRALQVGLDTDEADKLVRNIAAYSV